MTTLITGGTGYIGSHTAALLLEKGENVIILDNLSNSKISVLQALETISGKKIPFYKADLCNIEEIEPIFKEQKVDAVIHFAGLKAVGESVEKPLMYYKNNIEGTLNLLKVMEANRCKKIIFSSSATVYGDPARFEGLSEEAPSYGMASCTLEKKCRAWTEAGIPEEFPLMATNPYGATKVFIERILEDLWTSDKAWQIAALRYFNPIGAHPSSLIGEAPSGYPNNLAPYILDVLSGKREYLNVFGNDYPTKDGTGVRDYIHVMDLAMGHIAALEKLKDNPGVIVYNLGTGKGYSVLEVAKMFEKVSGKPVPFRYAQRRAGDIATCFANPRKAFTEMNWQATRGLEDMCDSAWKWISKDF